MIEIIPQKGKINALIQAPPSKGITLRAFFIAALAEGESVLKNPLLAEDQLFALTALKKFGVDVEIKKDEVKIQGSAGALSLPKDTIYIENSGVSARFLASFSAVCPQKGKIIIDGNERMRQGRPIQDLLDALEGLGVKAKSISGNGCLPIEIEANSFRGGKTKLKGDISSQYFSSILIAAPYAKEDTEIECEGEMSSKPYIDITKEMMKEFGVEMKNDNYRRFFVRAGQRYIARVYKIEGDYTNASYFFAMAAVCGGRIRVGNLKIDSVQGDKIFLEILEKMGCKVIKRKEEIEIIADGNLRGIKMDMNSYPDLVPTLSVVAAFSRGETEIKNIYHLRFKECDRIAALAKELKKLGVNVKEKRDGLLIKGDPDLKNLKGAEIECYKDHRIAMAFSVAGLKIPHTIIKDEKCVGKSFVNFYEVFEKAGGKVKKL